MREEITTEVIWKRKAEWRKDGKWLERRIRGKAEVRRREKELKYKGCEHEY